MRPLQLALQLHDTELGIGNAHREVLYYAKRPLDSSSFVAFPPMFAGVSFTTHKAENVLLCYPSRRQRYPVGSSLAVATRLPCAPSSSCADVPASGPSRSPASP